MPENSPQSFLDLEDLSFHEGVTVLLRKAIGELRMGEMLELHGDSPDLESELRIWCRYEGHLFHTKSSSAGRYCIERNAPGSVTLHSGNIISDIAEPEWGLAPRGAAIEAGGPTFHFPLRAKRDVWAEGLANIHRQSVNNQWTAAKDIPWSLLPKLPADVERAVCQIMTFLTENEFAALYIPARFLSRIHPHYREVIEVLAMQIGDESRHAETFQRRAEEGGLGLGTTAAAGQLSLQSLIEEADFTTAVFLLCVMGEGTFLPLLKFLEAYAPDPVTGVLLRLAHRDEARHVAFGMEHMRFVFGVDPMRRASLAAAVERRSQVLASVSGLSPYVHDALVIYSGGGITPAHVRLGAARVSELHRDMDRSRRERLQNLGFESRDAEQLSSFHTKNFM